MAQEKGLRQFLIQFSGWLTNTAVFRTDPSKAPRSWCLLGLEKLDLTSIRDLFKRKELNDKYLAKYQTTSTTGRGAYSLLQPEINALSSMHRSFNERHKTRLACYRDDTARKRFYLQHSLAHGLTLLEVEQTMSERDAGSYVQL